MPNQGKTKLAPSSSAPAMLKKQDTKRAKPQAASKASGGAVDYDLLQTLLGYALRRSQLAVFQHFAQSMASSTIGRAGDVTGDATRDAKGEGRVSPGEFGVLVLVEANPGINQTSLANAVGADRSTMVPIIDRLEKRGLLERQAMPGDRRAHALRLAKSGKERMQRFRAIVIEHESQIGGDLSAAERAMLLDLLRRLRLASETA